MEKEKIDKKDHILDVAERVFAEQGYDGASTRMISGEAGVNMAMLNYYFGSKEGVFLAIFERRISAFQSTLLGISNDSGLDPWARLSQFVDKYLDKVINNNCFHIMLNREVSKSKKTELTDKITTIIMRNVHVFKDIIEDGIKTGAFNKDADRELLIATMFGTKNYIVNTPHISSAILGYDVMDTKMQEDKLKPRLKNYMKTLLKAYLMNENDNK
ncbi:TetR/AcrR family transcriptional regulator [Mucilaginibacter achroorhodeus]|uniref:TetR/AcrR family transcriptional regulator n=1 Tax=Mucilaginibacter achroorhodeus TaxID=2599294 RepID=A0A563TXV2_9SPHI|nr:TetR/AcrR family transcriptional regulator [Mucilaginibacter achroorhodeus]TWR23950.1 TetR/AcrR family transcriptional regulator [Mucilaginibacter achroorhodeus]